ncbi:acyl-CoA thioesterase [Rubellicoccus peritrichatus]|uniref:Hotdog domain-containing protein n=1 Tax=Rubellicoccus peritrichatus TaxID=3080537 RepID=A0AAQ3QU65_9BACT|nr:thioesterase family protein [Puniceicoccus sp. CR14]WOO39317.1 hotdog domain-containing protein [Puniceicoccus sp. CR14]
MSFKFRTQVSKADCDGLKQFIRSRQVDYCQKALEANWSAQGLPVVLQRNTYDIYFELVHCHCDFRAPIKVNDTLDIHVSLFKHDHHSLVYDFSLERDGKVVGATLSIHRSHSVKTNEVCGIHPELIEKILA